MERGIEHPSLFCYLFFMTKTATIQDVLDTMNTFATYVEGQFTELKQDVSSLKEDVVSLKQEMASLKLKVDDIEKRLTSVEKNMITKDYLDKKLAELRSDIVLMSQRANTKLSILIEELVGQKILTIDIAQRILALEPFPQK